MRVLVYGLGRSGLAAGLLVASQGNRVAFFDRRDEGEDIDRALAEGWERPPEPTRWAADLCIAAPGVPINHPDLVALRRTGVETIGEVEWVYRSVRVPIVGITGTAGKSTVTAWTTHILRQAGHPAVAGGNIDPPLCSVASEGIPLIAELSSFQLERCPTLRPKVAAVLNLGEDHLDRHGSLEAYQAAKRNAVANQGAGDTMVIAASDQTLAEWAYDSEARILRFGTDRSCDGKLVGGRLVIAGREVCNQNELSVAGEHNRTNALAAALIAYAYGLPPAALEEGLRTFAGLPGRFRREGVIGGVEIISDSYATRPLSVRVALESCRKPVVWIGGGKDKGASFNDLAGLVRERVTLFIGVGASGRDLADSIGRWVCSTSCTEASGREALRCALATGLEHLGAGGEGSGTVLLAPMAASFDQFRDYRHRAEIFATLVREEEERWTATC